MADDYVVPPPDTKLPGRIHEWHNPTFIIRYRGLVDLTGLYKLVTNWVRYQKFQMYEAQQKIKDPKIEFKLDCRRKKTAYKRDRIYIHFLMFRVRQVEVVVGDKIKKMEDIRMKIYFKSFVETNYGNFFGWQRFQASKLTMFFENFINRYILKKEIDLADTDALYYELYQLHTKVKSFLKMETRGNAY